jgi:hypothetical protein
MRAILKSSVAVVWMLGLAACGDDAGSGAAAQEGGAAMQWLSTGGPCDDLAGLSAQQKEDVGFVFCSNAGKTFTGQLRCERDYIEVQCR